MKIVVTGSRRWTDREAIERKLAWYPKDTVVVHGDCPTGADRIAAEIATELGFRVIAYPARWDLHGRAAGPIRNRQMLEAEKPDVVLAFTLPDSKGTLDCIRAALELGITVLEIQHSRDSNACNAWVLYRGKVH